MSRGRRPLGSRGAVLSPRGLGGLMLILAGAGLLLLGVLWLAPGPKAASGETTTVVLDRGVRLPQMANQLKEAHVIRSKLMFMVMAKVGGGSLKAGEYAFRSGESLAGVVSDLKAGRVVRHFVTIPEGWTSAMAADEVNASPVLTGEVAVPPEGTLLPETYEVRRGEDRAKVIARMREAQAELLAQLWPKRRPDLPFRTPQEAVTLASIVEKETGIAAERPRIAAVFVNRLKAGMRLESDPTVIYGVARAPSLGRPITVADLASPTPYNTYQIAGLPPTPIANPGKAAIAAVLNPPATNELFFVANGTGGHVFSNTFEEHQRNVVRWRQIEKQRSLQRAAR